MEVNDACGKTSFKGSNYSCLRLVKQDINIPKNSKLFGVQKRKKVVISDYLTFVKWKHVNQLYEHWTLYFEKLMYIYPCKHLAHVYFDQFTDLIKCFVFSFEYTVNI